MEWEGYLRFVVVLIFVLGLIGLLAALARRAGFGFPTTAIRNAKDRRLGVVEVTPVDARRRLVLVRRDETEHLLLIGPTTELVVETGIVPPSSAMPKPDFQAALEDATATTNHKADGA